MLTQVTLESAPRVESYSLLDSTGEYLNERAKTQPRMQLVKAQDKRAGMVEYNYGRLHLWENSSSITSLSFYSSFK
jgi:hypothetical protein